MSTADPPAAGRVMVVEDDSLMRRWLERVLERAGFSVQACASGQEALAQLGDDVGVVCLDLGLGDIEGLRLLGLLLERSGGLSVVVITADSATETIVEAMRLGAYDYLVKPLDPERARVSVMRAHERQALRREVQRLKGGEGSGLLVGESPAMRELRRQLARIAESDVTVCVQGETGTGKELVAREIHARSRRRKGPFVALNCAAVPEALEEAELFGHEKGAFTGATGPRKGRFEQAEGGTLFLDEVGDMAPSTQTALLRTLQQRAVTRVGGAAEIPVDVRIVSATHRDLAAEVEAGRFRQDLYYRLVVYPLRLPALRERRMDLPALLVHALKKLQVGGQRVVARVSPEALSALDQHDWPGNVRELENVAHRALLACDGDEIELRHLPPELRGERPKSGPRRQPEGPAAQMSRRLKEVEREAIQRAMVETAGHVGKAAELLGMSRATLYRRLSQLD